MFLVELVMQGVRGVHQLARLRFQSGFNIVIAGNESGKTTAVDSLVRLLYPANQPGLMDTLISRAVPDGSRGALVAYADDSAYYRVIEDFSKRAVNLSKYNPASKDFSLVYKDWDSTSQFMAGLTGGMSEHEFSRLFVLRRDHYGNGSAAAAAAPVRQAVMRKLQAMDDGGAAAITARIAKLREVLQKSEEAADADYQYQSARLKTEEVASKLAKLDEVEQRYAESDASLETLAGCETLPTDLVEQLASHEQRQTEKMAKSEELTQDIDSLNQQLAGMPGVDLMTDKIFLAGAALGILSIVAGLFVLTDEQKLYFPLGLVLSFGLMAYGWYTGSQRGTQRKAVIKEIEDLEAELGELEKSFAQGGAVIEQCMKATDCTTTAELKDKVDQYHFYKSLRSDLDQDRRLLLGEQTPEELRAEYEKLQQQTAELAEQAQALAGNAVDTYSLRQDIERLEGELGQSAGVLDFGRSEEILETRVPAPIAAGPGFTTEIAVASRIAEIEIETLVAAVEAAAQRNLATVTGGRYVRIEVGQDGEPAVHTKDNARVGFSELSHGTRELVYFCVRTGLVEALAGKRRLPFILDDPLPGLDPARQQAACQILRTLGTKTQVILLTSNPALRSAGDAAAELK